MIPTISPLLTKNHPTLYTPLLLLLLSLLKNTNHPSVFLKFKIYIYQPFSWTLTVLWTVDQINEVEPEMICDLSKGFCCSGYQFHIDPNQTISPNETLLIYRGEQYVGNITKLRYGCKGSQKTTYLTSQNIFFLLKT